MRGDLIETFKILTGQSDVKYQTWFKLARDQEVSVDTRARTSHLNLVQPVQAKSEVRKNFSHREWCLIGISYQTMSNKQGKQMTLRMLMMNTLDTGNN